MQLQKLLFNSFNGLCRRSVSLISVGDYGRNTDGRVIRSSGFLRSLSDNKLNIPLPAALPNEESSSTFPMFFVGDEAFPLNNIIMRPYPRRNLTNAKRIFNYRLSRARKSVQCSSGMLVSKFRIFEKQIECEPDNVIHIVKAAVFDITLSEYMMVIFQMLMTKLLVPTIPYQVCNINFTVAKQQKQAIYETGYVLTS